MIDFLSVISYYFFCYYYFFMNFEDGNYKKSFYKLSHFFAIKYLFYTPDHFANFFVSLKLKINYFLWEIIISLMIWIQHFVAGITVVFSKQVIEAWLISFTH